MWNFMKLVGITFEENWNEKNASLPFIMLYICAVYYLWRKKRKNIKTIFVYPAIIYACTIFNPFVHWILIEKLGFSGRSHRFFWVIPMALVLAYAVIELLGSIKETGKRLGLCAIIVGICIFAGRPMTYEEHYQTENIYKVTDALVDISSYLKEIKGTEEKRVFFNDDHMGYMARQYDPSLVLALDTRELDTLKALTKVGYKDEEAVAMMSDTYAMACYFCKYFQVEDTNRIIAGILNIWPEYIILDYQDRRMEDTGIIQLLDSVDGYYIYEVANGENTNG